MFADRFGARHEISSALPPERKLAHDLRNCLNTLKLNSQCLTSFSDLDVIESLDFILQAADEVDALIGKLDANPDLPSTDEMTGRSN